MNDLKNREKLINIKYAALQFLAWAMYSAEISFLSTQCTMLGYSSGEIGTIVGLSFVSSIGVQQIAAILLDKFRRFTTGQCLIVMTLLKMALVFSCLLLDSKSLLYSVLRVIIAAVCMAYEPILSAYSGIFSFNNIHVSYGFGRGFGSFGYAIAAALTGRLISQNEQSIYYVMLTAAVLNLLAVLWISGEKFDDARSHMPRSAEGKSAEDGSFMHLVLNNRILIAILFAAVFAIGANSSYSTFLVQLVYDNGGTSVDYGNLTAFAAMMEILSFVFFDKIKKHFEITHILKFSLCFFALKHVILLFSKKVFVMYLAMLCQPVGFALMTACFVECVLHLVGLRHVNKGQALLGTFQKTGSVLGTITSGFLAQSYSIRTAFGVICMFCFVSLAIVLIFVKQTPRRGYLD